MANMINKFKQAQTKANSFVSVEDLLEEAVALLGAHEGEEHVGCIEHLFEARVVKALKEEGILEQNKFYSKRQAASQIWLLWRQM